MEKLRKVWGWDARTRGLLEFWDLKIKRSQAHRLSGLPVLPTGWRLTGWPCGLLERQVETDCLTGTDSVCPGWVGREQVLHRICGNWPAAASCRRRAAAAAAQPPPLQIGCNWPAAASPATAASQVNSQWVVETPGQQDWPTAAASPVNSQCMTGTSSCPSADELQWSQCSGAWGIYFLFSRFKFRKGAGHWLTAEVAQCVTRYIAFQVNRTCQWCVTHYDF
jgi:hypothetical protein